MVIRAQLVSGGKSRPIITPMRAHASRNSFAGRFTSTRMKLPCESLAVQPACEAPTAEGVLQRVVDGEADAGVVYVTSFRRGDASVAGVERVEVPAAHNTRALYSIGTIRTAKEPQAALAFRDFVLGERGQAILREAGFQPPD